jgi:hypothetical protein
MDRQRTQRGQEQLPKAARVSRLKDLLAALDERIAHDQAIERKAA